jgi:hypothetical protein
VCWEAGHDTKHLNESGDGNLLLAEEHLVFKYSSIDPGVKCSEIVASVNVKKVTSGIITAVMISLRDLLPMVGLVVGMATSDAAGCNWVSYRDTLSTHTFRDALPREMIVKYHTIDYDVQCLMRDPVTRQWVIFFPDIVQCPSPLCRFSYGQSHMRYGLLHVALTILI